MQNHKRMFRLATVFALFTLTTLFGYAQAVKKVSGPRAAGPTLETGAARSEGQPIVKDYEKVLQWLNANPGKVIAGGGNGGTSKFVYRLLEVVVDRLPDMPIEDIDGLCCHMVVPKPSHPVRVKVYTAKDFEGTVYIPKEFQSEQGLKERRRLELKPDPNTGSIVSARGMPNPYLTALREIQIALFDLSTGAMLAQTKTDGQGRFKFSGISPGHKALFVGDGSGNIYFIGDVEACGRNVGPNGQGCTEMGPGGRYPNAQFTFAPEVGNAYHSLGKLKWMR